MLAEKSGDSRNIHQPGANCVDDEFGGLVNSERIHNVGTVYGDCVGAEFESNGDFLVRLAVNDHLQHLKFPLREACIAFAL